MSSQSLPPATPRLFSRNMVIGLGVLVFHVAALWALQSGLLRRAVEVVVPAQILSEFITAPVPMVEPPPPPEVKPVAAKPPLQPQTPQPVAAPQPVPVAIADTTPAPAAPVGVTTPQAPPPPIAAPVAAAPVAPPPPAPPAPAKVEPPIIDADYAANEELFRAPLASQRQGEHGRVLLSVTVGVNGFASSVAVLESSGFPRLDNAAIAGAKKLKFRPAMRSGVPVEWTYRLPVNYSEPK